MRTLFDDSKVGELLGVGLAGAISGAFRSMEIAEEEIARARGTDERDENDPVWCAFALLRSTDDLLMRNESTYRAHCRELLARVMQGKDTRPATDAEIMAGITQASLEAPMHGAIVGLQGRLMSRALPDEFESVGLDLEQYERMYGREMDEWEARLRRKARQDWRVA
jgi:hypothetical protein